MVLCLLGDCSTKKYVFDFPRIYKLEFPGLLIIRLAMATPKKCSTQIRASHGYPQNPGFPDFRQNLGA